MTGSFPYTGDQNQVIYKIKNCHFDKDINSLEVDEAAKTVLLKLLEPNPH